jgi:hypothetical protein
MQQPDEKTEFLVNNAKGFKDKTQNTRNGKLVLYLLFVITKKKLA